MGERVVRHQRSDVAEFRGFRFQEFAPRGNAVKKIGDADRVPAGKPVGFTPISFPPANSMRVPSARRPRASRSSRRETAAIDGSASPRNPSVAIESRSSAVRSFEVACRSKASSASSRSCRCRRQSRESCACRRIPLRRECESRPRIQRVLQQLLHHRRGPLDHFACGDAIGDSLRKYAMRCALGLVFTLYELFRPLRWRGEQPSPYFTSARLPLVEMPSKSN